MMIRMIRRESGCNIDARSRFRRTCIRQPFLRGTADRECIFLSGGRSFRHSQTRFCQTDLNTRACSAADAGEPFPRESQKITVEEIAQAGPPSNYTSECFVFGLLT